MLWTIAEEQFAKVDAQYSSSEDTALLRFGGIENRILSLQRQLEERSRAELDMAVRLFPFSTIVNHQSVSSVFLLTSCSRAWQLNKK